MITTIDPEARKVDDFSIYCDGDVVPNIQKKISSLIVKTRDYIVFLDEQCYVQWSTNKADALPNSFGTIMNRVAYLETVSLTHLPLESSRKELEEFRRMLAEAVGNLFDGDEKASNEMLNRAEQLLRDRSAEQARVWYLRAALITTGVALVLAVILWLGRGALRECFGREAFRIAICSLSGAFGAQLFVFARINTVNLNSSAGPSLHYLEGCARILAGIFGALFVALLIKANLLAGAVNTLSGSTSDAFVMAFCIAAGMSERIVPNFVSRMEVDYVLAGEKKTKATGKRSR